jgi:hypothetical protein
MRIAFRVQWVAPWRKEKSLPFVAVIINLFVRLDLLAVDSTARFALGMGERTKWTTPSHSAAAMRAIH